MFCPTYVINLPKHSYRKKSIIDELNSKNIKFQLIEAIDWEKSNLYFLNKHLHKNFWDPNGWISYPIICCQLSHRKAWEEFLNSGEEIGLFLEDDIKVTNNFDNINLVEFKEDLDYIDWGVCFLGKNWDKLFVGEHIAGEFYEYDYFNNSQYAAHSYMLNRKSAYWFYKNTEKIKYATDIRLEISPFRTITTSKSLFIQKHKYKNSHPEFTSTTNINIEDSRLGIINKRENKLIFNNKAVTGYNFSFNE